MTHQHTETKNHFS